MANNNVIKIKNSTVAGKKPQPAQLQKAELAINLVDKKIYTKDQTDSIIELGGNDPATVDDILDGTSPEKYVNGPELRKVIAKEKVADISLSQIFPDSQPGLTWVVFSGKEILKSRDYKLTFDGVEQTGTLSAGDTLEQATNKITNTVFSVVQGKSPAAPAVFLCGGVILKGKKGQTLAQFISTNVDRLNNDPYFSQFITFFGTANTFTLTAKSSHVFTAFNSHHNHNAVNRNSGIPQRAVIQPDITGNIAFGGNPVWSPNAYVWTFKNDCTADFEIFINFLMSGVENTIGFGYYHYKDVNTSKIVLDPIGEDFIVSLNSDGEVDESIMPDLFTKDNNAFGKGQRSWLSPNSISSIVFKTYYVDRTYYVNSGNAESSDIQDLGNKSIPFATEKHALDIISDYFVRPDVTVTIDVTKGAVKSVYKYVYPNTVIAPRSDFTTANSPLNQSKFSNNGIIAVDDTDSAWIYTKGAWKEL